MHYHNRGLSYEERMKQLSKYEDILDVFIHILILRLPTAFILINMTMMIWLVQTIFSNYHSQSIPNSLYFFAPLLAGKPILDIQMGNGLVCGDGYEQITLKNLPRLIEENITHSNLTKWDGKNIICQKVSQGIIDFSQQCQYPQQYCSGVCANTIQQCPITSIRKLSFSDPQKKGEYKFYESHRGYKFVFSRENKPTFFVGIRAQYESKCANEFYYWSQFANFREFWNASKECGSEGMISTLIFHAFDSMATDQFFLDNGVWSDDINNITSTSETQIGTISRISFSKSTTECRYAENKARTLSEELSGELQKPEFSKNLLIMSFIFFTISWAWLISYYCFCEGRMIEKNVVVLLLAVIQFIAIAFIYYQNDKFLEIETLINQISKCIDEPITAFEAWTFGDSNRYPLASIMFACACFLLLQLVSYYITFCLYEPYSDNDSRNQFHSNDITYLSVSQDMRG